MLEYIIALVVLSAVFFVIADLLSEKGIEHAEHEQQSGSSMIHCGTRGDGSAEPYGQSGESCL